MTRNGQANLRAASTVACGRGLVATGALQEPSCSTARGLRPHTGEAAKSGWPHISPPKYSDFGGASLIIVAARDGSVSLLQCFSHHCFVTPAWVTTAVRPIRVVTVVANLTRPASNHPRNRAIAFGSAEPRFALLTAGPPTASSSQFPASWAHRPAQRCGSTRSQQRTSSLPPSRSPTWITCRSSGQRR